jgi:4-hydroxy-tetrahydrodipicolinate synthase
MKEIIFKGCGTALATPFTENTVNIKEFKKLLEFQLENDVDALVVCGTTGESSTMTQEERKSVIQCAVKASNNKVPIIVGTGSNNTIQSIVNSKIAQDLGADALLIVTPYYNKCTQYGLIKHYSTIAEKVSIPIILYNVPSRTGVKYLKLLKFLDCVVIIYIYILEMMIKYYLFFL